jgi:hypothetical protein
LGSHRERTCKLLEEEARKGKRFIQELQIQICTLNQRKHKREELISKIKKMLEDDGCVDMGEVINTCETLTEKAISTCEKLLSDPLRTLEIAEKAIMACEAIIASGGVEKMLECVEGKLIETEKTLVDIKAAAGAPRISTLTVLQAHKTIEDMREQINKQVRLDSFAFF